MDAILNHARAELPWGLLGHDPVEDQLHPVRPAQVQIVADDLFEELASAQASVEDLRQTYFHLPDRQVPIVDRRRTGSHYPKFRRRCHSSPVDASPIRAP